MRHLLAKRESGGIIFTTVQKFTLLDDESGHPILNDRHMRDALPNASLGTPIESEDKDTRAEFGDYVSIYDIQDALDDGATVPIFYESGLAKLDINQETIEELSDQVEEVVEDEEDVGAREKTKGEWSRLEKLVGAGPRLREVAEDLVNHFETRNSNIEGKAMIVAMSREICAHLYNEIVALRPEWHDEDPEKGAIGQAVPGRTGEGCGAGAEPG